MRYFLTLFVLLIAGVAWAQFEKEYISAPVTDTIPVDVYKHLKVKLERDKNAVQESKSQVNAYIKSLYDKRFEFLVDNFNKDFFIVDGELIEYLQHILNDIYDANPQLSRDAQVYVYRSAIPNAMSFGDGTIGFNLGLLSRMENKAQVAFVICHELAHYYGKHSDRAIHQLAELNFDKELKKKVKDIRSSEYNRYTRLKELFKGLGLSLTKHSRDHEFEADSMGLIYYSKTKYDLSESIRTMEILDSADVSQYRQNIDFKKFFDFKEFSFKESWTNYTKSETWHASVDEDGGDSTKTHPSCKRRIIALNRQIERLGKTPGPKGIRDKETDFIRTYSDFELVTSAFHFKQYGIAMFRAMILIDYFPDNAYLHAMIGKSLYQMYKSQKEHELGKVLELPDPRFEENYDRFLSFAQSLRLHEVASLSYYYMVHGKEEYFSNEDYIHALWLCSSLDISKLDGDKIKMEYQDKFPSGKYLAEMNK